jgi:hypothetical protein
MTLAEPLAFLLPAPLAVADVVTARHGSDLTSISHSPAVLVHGRAGARRLAASHPHAHSFACLPPRTDRPRACVPRADLASARRLLMTRAAPASVARRATVAVIDSLPSAVFGVAGSVRTMATRHESSVAAALRDLVPGSSLGVLIGNSEQSQRATVFAFRKGQAMAVAKVVRSAEHGRRLGHEADTLHELTRVSQLVGTIPRCLAQPEFHLGAALVTDVFSGHPAPLELTAEARRWLGRCVLDDAIPVVHSEPVARVWTEHGTEPDLRAVLEVARDALRDTSVARTVVHGDFAPWNVIVDDGEAQVFDWEYGTVRGVPEWDALHFVAQVGVIVNGWDASTLRTAVEGVVACGSAHYAPAALRALAVFVVASLAGRAAGSADAARTAVLTRAAHGLADPLVRIGV